MDAWEDLRPEWEQVLHDHRIYDVDSYGWRNSEDIDTEYVGYAMWTLTPPYEQEWLSAQHEIPPSRRASTEQQRLIELGEDFQGLMKAARYSIGMALLLRSEALRHTARPNPFEFHALAALTTLVMASDRARDFVVLSSTGHGTKRNKERSNVAEALSELRTKGFAREAHDVEALLPTLLRLRDWRNDVVHNMATDIARVHKVLLEEERDAFEAGVWNRRRPRLTSTQFLGAFTFDATDSVDKTISRLCDAYRLVIKAGEVAYRVENRLRDSRDNGPASG